MIETLSPHGHKLVWRDVAEIVVGCCVMAFPVAVTEGSTLRSKGVSFDEQCKVFEVCTTQSRLRKCFRPT
jgi:uncharacterized membrane protein